MTTTTLRLAAAAAVALLSRGAAAHEFDCEKTVGIVAGGAGGPLLGSDGLPAFTAPPGAALRLDAYPALVGFRIRVSNTAVGETSVIGAVTDSITDGLPGALPFGSPLAPEQAIPDGGAAERIVVVPIASYEACLALGGAPADLACRPDGVVDNQAVVSHHVGVTECRARLECAPPAASCSGAACDDQNACTADACHAATGCSHVPVSCDDQNACTADACDAATGCSHAAVSCDDGVACTADACDPATGCAHVPSNAACDDANVCTADSCGAGGCAHQPLNGAPCGDGGTCLGGVCRAPGPGGPWSGILQFGVPPRTLLRPLAIGVAADGRVRVAGSLGQFEASAPTQPFLGGVSADGVVEPVVTWGAPAVQGGFYSDLAVDAGGAAWVVDYEGQPNVRRILADGTTAWEASVPFAPEGVAADGAGNAYVAGTVFLAGYWGGPVAAAVAKLDPAGALVWVRQLAVPTTMAFAHAVAVGPGGHVWVAGTTYSGTDLEVDAWPEDAFAWHLDPAGQVLWSSAVGAPGVVEEGRGIAVDGAGTATLVGQVQETPVDPGTLTFDVLVARLAPGGAVLWTTRIGVAGSSDQGRAVALDGAGGAWVTGTVFGALPGQSWLGLSDILLARLDGAGNVAVLRQLGTAADDFGADLVVDGTGRLLLTGSTSGPLGGAPPTGVVDGFVMALDGNGNP